MNILTKVLENVTNNFYKIIRKYDIGSILKGEVNKDFNNYINMVKSIDDLTVSFSTDLYKSFIQEIDENFLNSEYRKKYCTVINISERNIWTLFGEVCFNRRYYHDKLSNKNYYFADEILMFPKNLRFDPFVCAKVIEISSIDSMAKAGRTVSELIGKHVKFNEDTDRFVINRVTARNIVKNFKIPNIDFKERTTPCILYIMLDEHFVPSQYNNNQDWMVKACVIFEDIYDEYSSHKKASSKKRYRLSGKRVEASIDNDLVEKVLDYIYFTYDTDKIKKIIVMGDCATWITSFTSNLHFHKDLKVIFSIDGFHYSQALEQICTKKYEHLLVYFRERIKNNDKEGFVKLCNFIANNESQRKDAIENKKNYILNNWKFIQNYYHKVLVSCSMEAHISHVFADIFTSRPRAYSKKGLRQILKLRLLRVNGEDIQQVYFDVLNNLFQKKDLINLSLTKSNGFSNISNHIKEFVARINDTYIRFC